MATKWYGFVRIRDVSEKKVINNIDITFHLSDPVGAFPKKSPPSGAECYFALQVGASYVTLASNIFLSPSPDLYYVTYERQLLLEALADRDYILLEGPRRRRVQHRHLQEEIARFLIEPLLPQHPLIVATDK